MLWWDERDILEAMQAEFPYTCSLCPASITISWVAVFQTKKIFKTFKSSVFLKCF